MLIVGDDPNILEWQRTIVQNTFFLLEEMDVYRFSSLYEKEDDIIEKMRESDRRNRVRMLLTYILFQNPECVIPFVNIMKDGKYSYIYEVLCQHKETVTVVGTPLEGKIVD